MPRGHEGGLVPSKFDGQTTKIVMLHSVYNSASLGKARRITDGIGGT